MIGQTNASRLRGEKLRTGKPGRGSIKRKHGDVIILILRVNQPVHETGARFPVRRLGEHLRGHAGGSNAGVGEQRGERGDGASVRDVVVMPKREVRFAHDQVRDRHGPARLALDGASCRLGLFGRDTDEQANDDGGVEPLRHDAGRLRPRAMLARIAPTSCS